MGNFVSGLDPDYDSFVLNFLHSQYYANANVSEPSYLRSSVQLEEK